jgi:hypothetical protein
MGGGQHSCGRCYCLTAAVAAAFYGLTTAAAAAAVAVAVAAVAAS